MAINLSDNININSPKILDKRYGPWSGITHANENILSLQRKEGLTVGIQSLSGMTEYWYYNGNYASVGAIPIFRLYNRPLNSYEVAENFQAQRGRFSL